MEQFSTVNIFQRHYSYVGVALAIMIIGALIVIPMFNGSWELGCSTSLNFWRLQKPSTSIFWAALAPMHQASTWTRRLEERGRIWEVVDEGLGIARYGEQDSLKVRGRRLEFADIIESRPPNFKLYIARDIYGWAATLIDRASGKNIGNQKAFQMNQISFQQCRNSSELTHNVWLHPIARRSHFQPLRYYMQLSSLWRWRCFLASSARWRGAITLNLESSLSNQ